MDRKKQIYYARTYRRIRIRRTPGVTLAVMLVLTSVIAFIINLHHLTDVFTGIGVSVLSKVIPVEMIQIKATEYSVFGPVTYINLPAAASNRTMILWNFLVCLVLLVLMRLLRRSGRPLAIFSLFAVLTHMVSCLFFWFAGEQFPYTLGEYSQLYVKQQTGIWIVFLVLAGLVIALIGERDYLFKLVMFVMLMCYSFVFGTVRYILFLYLLHVGSLLYMAVLFFVFGPMFDFSYLVAFYAVFMNKNTKDYEYGKRRSAWKWS